MVHKLFALAVLLSLQAGAQTTSTPNQGRTSQDASRSVSLSFTGSADTSVHDQFQRLSDGTSVGGGYTTLAPGLNARYERAYRWWAGYSISYGQSNWKQIYNNKGADAVNFEHGVIPAQVRDLSAAYMLRGKALFYGLRPYAELGAGALVFDPTGNLTGTSLGGYALPAHAFSNLQTQTRFAGNGAVGLSMDLKEHLGVRAGYRSLAYISTNFKEGWSKQYTVAQQPTIGMYLKF